MKAPQTLRKPSNWQDFESLCKILWGEIWNCPEIQKNGRLGQEQFGVDLFGIPFGEDSYYGIQCKGKNEYNDNQFTEEQIDKEVEKAKTFEPPLKKFYLTTTAVNDSKIQAYVRKKNIEHIKLGIFEVHLFCWETIVDLIDENKRTHDWFVKSQNYKSDKSIKVTFQDDSIELLLKPRFKKSIVDYKQKIIPLNPMYNNVLTGFDNYPSILERISAISSFQTRINKSFCSFNLKIHNTGKDPIEDCKIFLQFEGEIQDLKDNNEVGDNIYRLVSRYVPNTDLWSDSMTGKITPKKTVLVGEDFFSSEEIYIKPYPKTSKIIIKWKLISRDFRDNGELILNIEPVIDLKYNTVLVEGPSKVGHVEGEIEDDIVDKKKRIKSCN